MITSLSCQLNMDVGMDQCNYVKHRFCLFGGKFSKHSAVLSVLKVIDKIYD